MLQKNLTFSILRHFIENTKKYQTKVCQIVDILVHLNEARNTNKISGISCFCHIYL